MNGLAEEDLCREYIGLTHWLAYHCVRPVDDGGEMAERDSDATLGLLKAVRTYDPAKGMGIKSWIAFCVKKRVLSGVRKRSGHGRKLVNQFLLGRAGIERGCDGHASILKHRSEAGREARRQEARREIITLADALPSRWAGRAVRLLLIGYTIGEAAREAGVHENSVTNMLLRIKAAGDAAFRKVYEGRLAKNALAARLGRLAGKGAAP